MLQTYSPNDPLFWLHHANVDRYFYIWQIENSRSQYNGGSLRDRMVPFNIPVSDAFTLPSTSKYCYTYSSGLGDARPLNKRNLVKQRNVGGLQCPAHIPDEYTLKMGCSLEHVRMTEEYICAFTKRLNQKKQLSLNIKIESTLNYNNPKIWRYESGQERDMVLECLE